MACKITKATTHIEHNTSTGKNDVKYIYELLVDAQSDLSSAPSDAYPGSFAYTSDGANTWMLDNDGNWDAFNPSTAADS